MLQSMGRRDQQRKHRQHAGLVSHHGASPQDLIGRRCHGSIPRPYPCFEQPPRRLTAQPTIQRTPRGAPATSHHFQLRSTSDSASSGGGALNGPTTASSEGGRRRLHLRPQNTQQRPHPTPAKSSPSARPATRKYQQSHADRTLCVTQPFPSPSRNRPRSQPTSTGHSPDYNRSNKPTPKPAPQAT
jgi:hypothetical protein